MTNRRQLLGISALILALVVLVPQLALAQGSTTGNLGGKVEDDNGGALPGVQVIAVHVPTGTKYTTYTRGDGRFLIQNVRVGGPYTVTSELQGFTPGTRSGVQVRLGEEATIALKMQVSGVEASVTVTGSTPLISPSHTGATSSVSEETLTVLPTVTRSFQDMARTSPYFTTDMADGGLSVAGRNNRYNSIQIDGAVNNDVFGLAASGTPGGQADTQPISLDAIQELQLVVSPYDVRQGGFSGGSINAITKSGTNDFHGSAFYYGRDESLVGKLDGKEIATFDAKQYGLSLGGPIMSDRLFFFFTGESDRKDNPSGFSADGTSGVDFCNGDAACKADVDRFESILETKYGHNAGGPGEFIRATDSDNIFARLDMNVNDANQVTLRHNYVDATADRYFPSSTTYTFPDNNYAFPSTTNSTVLQANSIFGKETFNELRISYQTIREKRDIGGDPFPQVTVRISGGKSLVAGSERFSGANALDQDIIELTDDLSFTMGNHTLTVGTHNEFYTFSNLFIRDFYGTYSFGSLNDFDKGWANRYEHSFARGDDPRLRAKFDVQQFGLYAGDSWRAMPTFTVTAGVRVDIPFFPDRPTRNNDTEVLYGLRTDVSPDGNPLWSPRVGFNWDVTGDAKQQVRGGIGIFSGRTPYVWLSNQYGNTGNEFTRLTATKSGTISDTNHIDFIDDPYNQPTSVGGAANNEVDLVDPHFKFPQVLRSTLGYDRDLGLWGMVGSLEGTYTEVLKEVAYQDVNLVQTDQTSFDGRPIFKKVPKPTGYTGQTYSNAVYMTNTDQGWAYTLAARLEKPFGDGWYGSLGYLYNRSTTGWEATSSQALSNWQYQETQGNPNSAATNTSDFEMQHRINAALSYSFKMGPTRSNVGVYFNRQSGRPYSTVFGYKSGESASINGDGALSNDLIYVPRSADEIVVQNGTWNDVEAYINADDGLGSHRGEIVPRNASRAPWVSTFDLHYGIQVPISVTNVELSFDILNLLNLIDDNMGRVEYASSNAVAPFEYRGIDATTGKPIYYVRDWAKDPSNRWVTNDLASRWQAKFGVRVSF